MPGRGLEPPHLFERYRVLSPARLPISPPRRPKCTPCFLMLRFRQQVGILAWAWGPLFSICYVHCHAECRFHRASSAKSGLVSASLCLSIISLHVGFFPPPEALGKDVAKYESAHVSHECYAAVICRHKRTDAAKQLKKEPVAEEYGDR